MKKLLDSKFLFILALSIIVLIILGVGAFYLFDDSDATFVKDGYVLNPLSAKSEKYFFDEKATYKENLNQMVVFNDVDKNEVKVLRDSFLHYMDGSLSFLKNGAILDLDSIKGKEAVKFYNITNKSIIDKRGDGYVIETNGDDIGLKNFIGRISDNKYIVVGSLEAKIPGNEKNITGDYFEIVYTDEGIVNIENKDIKYQVAAQGSYIYVGDIVIDLGDKKITKAGEDVMSITAITINGDENIEIIPKAPEEEDNNGGGAGDDNQGNNGEGDNQTPDNQGGNGGAGGNDASEQIVVEDLQVLLRDYDIDSTSITVSFDILNKREDDSLTLKVTDLATGRTVNEVADIQNKRDIPITLLSPENKYLFTVINKRNEEKYFQKIFETNSFGISLEKTYVTASEIGYKVNIDAGGNLRDARLMLKKFNESKDVNELETVASYQLKDIIEMTEGEHDGIIFSGLDSDTIYTAVLDSFSVASTNFNDIYNITLTSMTLKETPTFGEMQKEVTNNSFKLFIDSVVDPDNAITSYTYTIYNASDTEFKNPVISPIVKANASPVEVSIGGGENQLNEGTNYVYKVAIEYNDNEKYIEYMMDGSINLFKGKDPYVIIEDGDILDYDKFEALIYLHDNSCLIDIPSKCEVSADAPNDSIKVMVYEVGVMQNETFLREYASEQLKFEPEGEDGTYKASLVVDNLNRGTTYAIYVVAKRNDRPTEDFKPVIGTDENNTFRTKNLASFKAIWQNEVGSREVPIDASVKLEGIPNDKAVSSEVTMDIVKTVVFKLYDGEFNNDIASQKYIASSKPIVKTDNFSIKENFYDNAYPVTLDTFGLTMEELEEASNNEDGTLSAYYTIVVEAYYDYEMTEKNLVSIVDKYNPYHINPEIRNVVLKDPTLTIDPKKKVRNDYFDNSLTTGLIVGYALTADWDEDSFALNGWGAQSINFYVYDDSGNRVSFYVHENNKLNLVPYYTGNLGEDGFYKLDIYMGYGTDSGNVMTRGNKYYVGYEIIYTIEGESNVPPYPANNNPDVPARTGFYKNIDDEVPEKDKALKDQPKVKYAYIEETTKDGKVTYKYQITDIDNALVKTGEDNYIYYNINDEYKDELKLTQGESIRTGGLIEANIPVYQGEFTLSGLSNGDGYTLFYKALLDNNGEVTEKNIGKENRLFDGFYDAANYNFKFEVIPNLSDDSSIKNNKATVKMLAEEEILSRVLSYKITFSTPGVDDIVKEPWELIPCNDALEGEAPRCYEVQYTELKRAGMKSKEITVSVQAIYDNGLTGYGYEDKVGSGKEYPYMIMQENSTTEEIGKYHIINNKSLMKSKPGYPSGYYTFRIDNGWLYYNSMYNPVDTGTYELTLSSEGRGVSSGVMNPKMVSTAMMASDVNKNKLTFSSITPMIKEDGKISLINGARLYLSLSGADQADICVENSGNNCNTGNGERYLYVDVWDSEVDANDNTKTPIDTVKIKLNNGDSINGKYNTGDDLVNLVHGRKYYYTVYTYLNNGGSKKKTRVFDEILKDRAKVYEFDTKELLDIFDVNKLNVNIIPNNEGAYNDKLLKTSFTLNKYDSTIDIPFNFKLSYILCDVDEEVCDLDHKILVKDINNEDEETTVSSEASFVNYTDLIDITNNIANNEIEFGKEYIIKFYVTYDSYDSNKVVRDKVVPLYETNVLGGKTLDDMIDNLEFRVAREANYVDGDNIIELKITLSDEDRILLNGKYYVELRDGDGNLKGNLQLMNDDGIYTIVSTANDNYNEYPIEAMGYQTIRIGGLDPDTLYTVKVFGYPYMGDTSRVIASGEEGTGHRIYSSNDFGVAFGNSILYTFAASADENTIVANFGYGSHLKDNAVITSVTYTIKRDGSSLPPYSKTLMIDEEISFERYANTDNLIMRFNIDENEFKIIRGDQYIFTTSYEVYDPVSDRHGVIDYTVHPTLSGKVANYNANNS